MSIKLRNNPQIWTLAVDLGLKPSDDPVSVVISFVTARIRRIAKKFNCKSLNELLLATAGEVGTVLHYIHSDADLEQVQRHYAEKGESGFANLERELRSQDYAITLKRLHAKDWECPFVSVIDCRGGKSFSRYFSVWHELAHLLTLTSQRRLVFRRTHVIQDVRDPEEMLMDIIAGTVGFLPDFLPSQAQGDISFEKIQAIRQEFCPEASYQASLIGIVKSWPQPCILLEAKLALRKKDRLAMDQPAFVFAAVPEPTPSLRAVHVTVNEAARAVGIQFHKNWRVPKKSVVYRASFESGQFEAIEDLSWWRTSSGGQLAYCTVAVSAKHVSNGALALLLPRLPGVPSQSS
jgi:hypothetical protein